MQCFMVPFREQIASLALDVLFGSAIKGVFCNRLSNYSYDVWWTDLDLFTLYTQENMYSIFDNYRHKHIGLKYQYAKI